MFQDLFTIPLVHFIVLSLSPRSSAKCCHHSDLMEHRHKTRHIPTPSHSPFLGKDRTNNSFQEVRAQLQRRSKRWRTGRGSPGERETDRALLRKKCSPSSHYGKSTCSLKVPSNKMAPCGLMTHKASFARRIWSSCSGGKNYRFKGTMRVQNWSSCSFWEIDSISSLFYTVDHLSISGVQCIFTNVILWERCFFLCQCNVQREWSNSQDDILEN